MAERRLFLKVNRFRDDSGIVSDLSAIDLESDEEEEDCPVHENFASSSPQDPDDLISLLPQEVWIKIFEEFSQYELCTIGLTCKGFLNLTRDPSLWSELSIVGDAVAETGTVVELIARCSLLYKIRYIVSHVRIL